MYGIILAGGSGSRLWPLSRELYPKQLQPLDLNSDKSLLQSTFEHLKTCCENIVSMTNTKHSANVRVQLSKLQDSPIILSEPVSKNTAPAIILASKYIAQKTNSDPVIIAMPSDLLIKNNGKFLSSVKKGEELAKQGFVVTFGIKPNYPETGFGYIKTENETLLQFVDLQKSRPPAGLPLFLLGVLRFRQVYTCPLSQRLHRLRKRKIFILHHESIHIPADAAPEAVVHLLWLRHRKRRRLLIVKRATAPVVAALFLKLHIP